MIHCHKLMLYKIHSLSLYGKTKLESKINWRNWVEMYGEYGKEVGIVYYAETIKVMQQFAVSEERLVK